MVISIMDTKYRNTMYLVLRVAMVFEIAVFPYSPISP